jgi:hypothetical protein
MLSRFRGIPHGEFPWGEKEIGIVFYYSYLKRGA